MPPRRSAPFRPPTPNKCEETEKPNNDLLKMRGELQFRGGALSNEDCGGGIGSGEVGGLEGFGGGVVGEDSSSDAPFYPSHQTWITFLVANR